MLFVLFLSGILLYAIGSALDRRSKAKERKAARRSR